MPTPTNGEPMTLDGLARIINTSFEGMQKSFDSVRQDMASDFRVLDNKIDALDHKIQEESRLTREEVRKWKFAVEIDALEKRVKRLEQKLELA
jgi:ubiquinone biosynthesis protein UbiJ